MAPTLILFLIIFLEGYVVLSTELIAIRLLLPYTGSGTDTVSIIIAAVLMPLAFGYYYGGRFKKRVGGEGRPYLIRDKLIFNLVVSALILTPGLSFVFLDQAFEIAMRDWGWTNRLWLTTAYAGIFLVTPVFLLGQTVPLVSNYFSHQRLPAVAGRMLFFSTIGSFMGAVFCTLVLMTTIGVHNTVTVTIGCMMVLVFLLARKKRSGAPLLMVAVFAVAALLNSDAMMKRHDIVGNNLYNLIQIDETTFRDTIMLKLNRTYASAVYKDDSSVPRLDYVAFIEETFLQPLYQSDTPKDILVLGAGGFTMGYEDSRNNYIFVDIDKDLKHVAETHLLREELGPNKVFVPIEARAFLNQDDQLYDLIILDLYRDPISAPEYLVTLDFFLQVKARLKEGGVIAGNYFASPNFHDAYSVRLDNTMRAAFPNLNRHVIRTYNAFDDKARWANVIYSYRHDSARAQGIYTDNLNRSPFDKPARVGH